MKNWKKTVTFLYALLAIGSAIAGVLVYWSLTPVHVLTVSNAPVPVRPKALKPGFAVILSYNYCKSAGATGVLRTSIVSKTSETFLPVLKDTSPKMCSSDLDSPIVIPLATAPDTYHFHFRAVYQVNPLKAETDEWDSQSFQVQ